MDMAVRKMELMLMCPLSNVLIYSFAACIFVRCFQVSGISMTVNPATVQLGSTAPPKTEFRCNANSESNIKSSVLMTMAKLDAFGTSPQVFATADRDGTRFNGDTAPSTMRGRPTDPVLDGGIDQNTPSQTFFIVSFETIEMRCDDAGTYVCSYAYIGNDNEVCSPTDSANLSISANPSDMILTASKPNMLGVSLVGTINSPFTMKVNESISFTCHGKIGSEKGTLIRWRMSLLTSENSNQFMQYSPTIGDEGLPNTTPEDCSYSRTATMTYMTVLADAGRKNYLAFKCYADQAESTIFYIEVVGPPPMPIDPRVEDVYPTSVNVSWELGYHGGPGQIFIIQYSTDGETWRDGATLDTGTITSRDRHSVIVDSLRPGTLYSLRIHAYNQHGLSLNTDIINVTTLAKGADRRTSSSAVGPAVGGSAGALVGIALVVGLVVLHKKGYSIMRPCLKKKGIKYRDHTYNNEVETNVTRHDMSQARAASTTQDEGRAATLPFERLATSPVTTSTMNITGDVHTGEATRDGSVAGPYETLEPMQGENASFYDELMPHDQPRTPTNNQELDLGEMSSDDEELRQLKCDIARAKDEERQLRKKEEKDRLRAELMKTNTNVAQMKNRDVPAELYENL